MNSENGTTKLTEDIIECLDWADMLHVDLVLNPYPWDINNKSGIKAYLQTMSVDIEPSKFIDDYLKSKKKKSEDD